MRLEPRSEVSPARFILAPVAAVIASLLLCSGLILWSGASVFEAYWMMLTGSIGSSFALAETLSRATPLIFTGLAAAVAFRARFWNIGAEGQLYAGALMVTFLGTGEINIHEGLLPPILFLGSFAAGSLWLFLPSLIKIRFQVDEVVTTLLLNFVMLLLVSLLLEGPLKDPMGLGWPQAAPVLESAELPRLVQGLRVHAGLIIAVILALLIWQLQIRTTLGFEMRAVGLSRNASQFAGMRVGNILLITALISGGLAGLAGYSEVAGLKGNLTLDLSPGFGYTGIVVAMLAQLHPLGVIGSAFFVACIFVGADAMSRSVGVPNYIADVVVATSLLCMLVSMLQVKYRIRWKS